MTTAMELLQNIGVFLAGMLARVGLFLAMLALLVLPALAVALAIRAISSRRRRALGIGRVAGLLFRPDLFYTPGHLWLRPRRARAWGGLAGERRDSPAATNESGPLEMGLDDLALRLLPAVSAVDLPRAGTIVARGEAVAMLHGGGRTLAIPSPVAGTVIGVNAAVLRDPALVKRDGYGRGWLVVIEPVDPAFAALPHGAEAASWLERESARWRRFLEERLGFAAADGGELVAPAPWLVGEEGWRELTSAFLHG